MFKIIVRTGPAEKYINVCLDSILNQNNQDWECIVMIDPVEDKTHEIAIQKTFDPRIKVIYNGVPKLSLANTIEAVKRHNPDDEDILVMLDGDDWFYSPETLDIVDAYYTKILGLLVTHGSWVPYPNVPGPSNNFPYTKEDYAKGIRRVQWRGSALRTLKYKVWKHVKDEDMRDEKDQYFETCEDLSYMWPAMEMAGYDRVAFIKESTYVYNRENPLNDHKVKLQKQMFYTDYIAAKVPYEYKETF